MTESTNNGKRRRAAKAAAKPLGRIMAYNENAPRAALRKMLNSFTRCEKCGDRMLVKNLDEHMRKALLHVPEKAKKSKSKS